MSVITDIFRLLVFSNFGISIGAVAYSMVTVLQLDLDVPVEFYWFVGCCTLCSYSLQRFIQFSYLKKQSARQKWLGGNRLYVGGAVLFSGLGGVILGLTVLTAFQILCFVPVALISLLYSTRVLGKTSASKTKEKKSLRDVPGIKIFMVAISWSFLCGLMPIWLSGFSSINAGQVILVCAEKLFFIVAITIPFDIRDLRHDKESNSTIPQVFGVKKSIYIAIGLLVFGALCLLFTSSVSSEVATGLMLSYTITMILLLFVDEDKPELYFSGLIDSSMVLQLLLVWGAINLL